MFILLHHFEKFNGLYSNTLVLESTGYFLCAAFLPIWRYISLTIIGRLYRLVQERRRKDSLFSSPCISETFISDNILYAA
jgi:hypothetical protein